MRQVVLDTETTGLEPEQGHRIIEIGAVELIDRVRSGRTLQHYLNPEREVDQGALDVHGIDNEYLQDKPRFADIVEELVDFIRDSELIIHNAPFDVGFLDWEFSLCQPPRGPTSDVARVLDTLGLAKRIHPGQRNSLDMLCQRYAIDNTRRNLHGALLDAELLAEVYLALTGGQKALDLELSAGAVDPVQPAMPVAGRALTVQRASPEELAAHDRRLEQIAAASDSGALWSRRGVTSGSD